MHMTKIIITGLFITKLLYSQPRLFPEDPMLHASSQKAQKTLGITREDNANNTARVSLPSFKTTSCPWLGVRPSLGPPHLRKDTPVLEEVLRHD